MAYATALEVRYSPNYRLMSIGGVVGPLLEGLADVAHWRHHLPRPLDIFASGGNFWAGYLVSYLTIMAGVMVQYRANVKRLGISKDHPGADSFNRRDRRKFWVWAVPVVMVVVTLANLTTETQWGVDHLPIATWLNGKTPDPWDTIHSVAWGVASLFIPWKRYYWR